MSNNVPTKLQKDVFKNNILKKLNHKNYENLGYKALLESSYTFKTDTKEYILNVDKCKDVLAIQQYIEYAAIKGLTIKTKINLNKLK